MLREIHFPMLNRGVSFCSRAATAEAIAARATEELRLREAEAKAANAAAAEAKALCERAAEADRRATEARNNEVSCQTDYCLDPVGPNETIALV